MAKKGDTFRILRDTTAATALWSLVTDQAAAAYAYGFPFYGDVGAHGEQKAFLEEVEVIDGEPRRRVTYAFDARARVALEPMGAAETISLRTARERLSSAAWPMAHPGHPLAHIYAARRQRYQLHRKLLAGRARPRPATVSPDSLDLAPMKTWPGDPMHTPEPALIGGDRSFTFLPPPTEPPLDVAEWCRRWEDDAWRAAHPDHPISWVAREMRSADLPECRPEPGFPVGQPMESHQLLRRGRRRLWLPWYLDRAKKLELIARAKMS